MSAAAVCLAGVAVERTEANEGLPAAKGCRIDYVLVTAGLRTRVVSCEVLLETNPKWSDHAGVLIGESYPLLAKRTRNA